MNSEELSILETNRRGMRFLFYHGDKYLCLFSFDYKDNELYIASSQNEVLCGHHCLGEYGVDGNHFGIVANDSVQDEEYTSLKFSFHETGRRHLRAKNKLDRDVQFCMEQATRLLDLKEPEMLFTLVSKQISLYDHFQYESRTRKGKNAIVFTTPGDYSACKNIFHFFVSRSGKKDISTNFVPSTNKTKDYLVVRLTNDLFLHILFFIIVPDTDINNTTYPDREFFLFKHEGKSKFFSFRSARRKD